MSAKSILHDLSKLIPIPVQTCPSHFSNVKSQLSIEHLMAAHLHLGHDVKSWNKNMTPFIHGIRNGIHIINLDHTLMYLRRAINFTREIALRDGNIVFVGSRPFLHQVVLDSAREANGYFLTKWTGGLLTNKERVLKRSSGYDPDKVLQDDTIEILESLKEETPSRMNKSRKWGSNDPKQPYVHTPDVIIVLDYMNNLSAIKEANYVGIPVIAICDTDCDPTWVQYPIPANDDSITGCKLISGLLSKASQEGLERRQLLMSSKK